MTLSQVNRTLATQALDSSALTLPGPVSVETRLAVESIVQESAFHLDERRFDAWLGLTAPEFRYRIQAYSHDLRKDMTWLDHDRAGLAALFELLPKHHVNGADWLRQVVLQTVTSPAEGIAESVSSLALYQTVVDVGDAHVDGGSSFLFATGRYHDRLRRDGERWLLTDRVVRLHTRQLGIGSHLLP
jgi:methanesulfonate monooxygenase small subunit